MLCVLFKHLAFPLPYRHKFLTGYHLGLLTCKLQQGISVDQDRLLIDICGVVAPRLKQYSLECLLTRFDRVAIINFVSPEPEMVWNARV